MRHVRWLTVGLVALLVLLAVSPGRGEGLGDPRWTQSNTLDGLPADTVWAIAVSPGGGDVWLGTSHGASLYRDGRFYSYSRANGLGEDWVASLAVDTSGRVWFGTFGGGLTVLEGTNWRTYTAANSGLAADWVSALALGAGGQVWAGTWGHGVSLFDGRNWQTYYSGNSTLPSDYVTALATAPDGSLWVGLHGQGLAHLSSGRWTLFGAQQGLPDDFVNALATSPDGKVWVGTAKGLACLDGGGRLLHTYLTADGLPDDQVESLAYDGEGRLWAGTAHGAAALADGRWTVYHGPNTLTHDYVSAIATAPSGAWFGSLSAGVAWYGTGVVASARHLPVVLVHGWHGPDSDKLEDSEFRFLATWLRADGFPVYYAEGISPKNTLHKNAAQLRTAIDRARKETGAAQVDVIAFSMGGLNTRAYVESGLYGGEVDQAFILGTPQAGVRMWYPFLLREIHSWSRDPSAVELTPDYAALFNDLHRNQGAAPYTLIAGGARGPDLPQTLRGLPPGDALISAGSALALDGANVRRILTDDLHAWSDQTILMGVPSYLYPRRTYDAYIRNRLRLGPGAQVPGLEDPQPPSIAVPEVPQHSPFYEGEVAPGQTVTHTVPIDTAGEVRFYVRSQSGPLTLTLTDPFGIRVDSKAIASHGEYFDLDMAGVQDYLITRAIPGQWQVVVSRPADAASPGRYAGYATFHSPLRLAVGATPAWGAEGQPVAITATLQGESAGVSRARLEAEIGRPDAQADRLVLYDDGEHGDGEAGDGLYGATYRPPGLGGYYTLFVTARGQMAGIDYARTAERLFAVSPGTAALNGSYAEDAEDADRDGRFESLALEVGVEVRVAGDFLLAATLADSQGREVGRVVQPLALNAGTQTVTVHFPGRVVAQAAMDGPYTVSRVTLLDEAGAALPLQEAAGVLTTRPYRYQDFS